MHSESTDYQTISSCSKTEEEEREQRPKRTVDQWLGQVLRVERGFFVLKNKNLFWFWIFWLYIFLLFWIHLSLISKIFCENFEFTKILWFTSPIKIFFAKNRTNKFVKNSYFIFSESQKKTQVKNVAKKYKIF